MTWTCRLHPHGKRYLSAGTCAVCHAIPTRLLTCACCGATGLVPTCDHRTRPEDVDEPMPGSPAEGGPPLCWACACDCPPVRETEPVDRDEFEQGVLF